MLELRDYNFVAWIGVPSSIYLDGFDRALRLIVPDLVSNPNADSDEVEMWRFTGHQIVVEIQRPKITDPTNDKCAGLAFICMVSGQGQKRLDNSSALISQYLADATGVECRALGGD